MGLWLTYPPFDLAHYLLVFTLPAILGGFLLFKAYKFRLETAVRNSYLFAGLIVLKPLLATPIWHRICLPIFSGVQDFTSFDLPRTLIMSLLPGVVPTILLLIVFRATIFTRRNPEAWKMIVLDGLRWINSLAALIILSLQSLSNLLYLMVLSALGNLMPGIFAIIITGMLSRKYEPSTGYEEAGSVNAGNHYQL